MAFESTPEYAEPVPAPAPEATHRTYPRVYAIETSPGMKRMLFGLPLGVATFQLVLFIILAATMPEEDEDGRPQEFPLWLFALPVVCGGLTFSIIYAAWPRQVSITPQRVALHTPISCLSFLSVDPGKVTEIEYPTGICVVAGNKRGMFTKFNDNVVIRTQGTFGRTLFLSPERPVDFIADVMAARQTSLSMNRYRYDAESDPLRPLTSQV